MSKIKMIELFAGIRAMSLASEWIGGFETVEAVEINSYCSAYGNAIVPQCAVVPLLRVKYLASLL